MDTPSLALLIMIIINIPFSGLIVNVNENISFRTGTEISLLCK